MAWLILEFISVFPSIHPSINTKDGNVIIIGMRLIDFSV